MQSNSGAQSQGLWLCRRDLVGWMTQRGWLDNVLAGSSPTLRLLRLGVLLSSLFGPVAANAIQVGSGEGETEQDGADQSGDLAAWPEMLSVPAAPGGALAQAMPRRRLAL